MTILVKSRSNVLIMLQPIYEELFTRKYLYNLRKHD